MNKAWEDGQMDNFLLYDGGGLFCSPEFQDEVLKFFQAVGHTTAVAPLIVAEDILHCIYSELCFNGYFDKSERLAFSRIESLAYLFTLGGKVFYKPRISKVRYYAISLNTTKNDRTITANTILNAFIKNTSDYVVIMFRHEKMCMLSFAKKTNGCMIFFSDWFGEKSVFDITRKIHIGNFSLQNSDEFFLDFVYIVARQYYTHPMSKDYAYSQLYSINFLLDGELDYIMLSRSEYVAERTYAHIREYGDDYIEIPSSNDYQIYNSSDDDHDFDLLVFELDEMISAEAFEMGEKNDEYKCEEEGFLDIEERTNVENIPSEILSDPVKLLEWLRKNEKYNEDALSED